MPSTLKYGITYPAGNVAPNVPLAMQSTAESAEAAITTAVAKIRHAEYTTASVTTAANVARNVGAVSADGTKTFNNTFVSPGTNAGEVKILEAGVYAIDFTLLPGAVPGNTGIQIVGTSVVRVTQAFNTSYGSWELTATATNVYLPANEVLVFSQIIAVATNVGARIRITKLQGV